MKSKTVIPEKKFMLRWVFSSIIVYPIAFLISFPFIFLVAITFGILFGLFLETYVAQQYYNVLMIMAFGAGAGFSIGMLQYPLLYKLLHLRVTRWRSLTLIGGVIAVLVVEALFSVSQDVFSVTLDLESNLGTLPPQSLLPYEWLAYLAMPLLAGVVSVFQWIELRRWVAYAWVWIIAHVGGGFAFSGVVMSPNAFLGELSQDFLGLLLSIVFVASIMGIVTGYVMLWLIKYYQKPDPTKRKPKEKAKNSVWEEAI